MFCNYNMCGLVSWHHGHSGGKSLISAEVVFYSLGWLIRLFLLILPGTWGSGVDIHFKRESECPPRSHCLNSNTQPECWLCHFIFQILFFFFNSCFHCHRYKIQSLTLNIYLIAFITKGLQKGKDGNLTFNNLRRISTKKTKTKKQFTKLIRLPGAYSSSRPTSPQDLRTNGSPIGATT